MVDTPRGRSCAVLDIDAGDRDPETSPILRDELLALVERTVAELRTERPKIVGTSTQRTVLEFAPRPAHHRSVDQFLDALAASLDRRNTGLDLDDRLRITVAVDSGRARPDLASSSPLSRKVLAAAPAAALVVEVTERWYIAGAPVDPAYVHVRSGAAMCWLRVPGRSTVRGVSPVDLVIDEPPPPPEPRRRGAMQNYVNGNHIGDNIEGVKVTLLSSPPGEVRRDEFPEPRPGTVGASRKGSRGRELRSALVAAYTSFDELDMMFRERLGLSLHRLVSANLRLELVVSKSIERAQAEGWLDKLVTAAFLGNPGNPALRRLVETGFYDEACATLAAIEDPTGPVTRLVPQAGLLADLVADADGDQARPWSGSTLERIFRTSAAFQDVVPFTSRLLAVAAQVCQVRVGPGGGSGFLVGPDLVLTNHHVVADVISGRMSPADLRFVFDHRLDEDERVEDGTAFEPSCAGRWLVASSPPDELDYALIRLAEEAGRSPSLDGRQRGWLRPLDPAPELVHRLPLLILQHPLGHPMKLALSDKGVGEVVDGGGRVTYEVNTERGSSGSPCLTFDLRLVALHRGGSAEHNTGVPILAIAEHLDEAGRTALQEEV
jgi:hypothetical protein